MNNTARTAFYDELEKICAHVPRHSSFTPKEKKRLSSAGTLYGLGTAGEIGGLGLTAASFFKKPGKGSRYMAGAGLTSLLGGVLARHAARSKVRSVKKDRYKRQSEGELS